MNNHFKIGDKVRLSQDLKTLIWSGMAYHMFVDNKLVYKVLSVSYDLSNNQMVELDNHGLHYLFKSDDLILDGHRQTVGFLIED